MAQLFVVVVVISRSDFMLFCYIAFYENLWQLSMYICRCVCVCWQTLPCIICTSCMCRQSQAWCTSRLAAHSCCIFLYSPLEGTCQFRPIRNELIKVRTSIYLWLFQILIIIIRRTLLWKAYFPFVYIQWYPVTVLLRNLFCLFRDQITCRIMQQTLFIKTADVQGSFFWLLD